MQSPRQQAQQIADPDTHRIEIVPFNIIAFNFTDNTAEFPSTRFVDPPHRVIETFAFLIIVFDFTNTIEESLAQQITDPHAEN